MKTIYLCGPINGCTDEECKDWRELVKADWGPQHCLDPMRRDYRGREAESVNEIVTLDKVDIANSDAILVNYDKPSDCHGSLSGFHVRQTGCGSCAARNNDQPMASVSQPRHPPVVRPSLEFIRENLS